MSCFRKYHDWMRSIRGAFPEFEFYEIYSFCISFIAFCLAGLFCSLSVLVLCLSEALILVSHLFVVLVEGLVVLVVLRVYIGWPFYTERHVSLCVGR